MCRQECYGRCTCHRHQWWWAVPYCHRHLWLLYRQRWPEIPLLPWCGIRCYLFDRLCFRQPKLDRGYRTAHTDRSSHLQRKHPYHRLLVQVLPSEQWTYRWQQPSEHHFRLRLQYRCRELYNKTLPSVKLQSRTALQTCQFHDLRQQRHLNWQTPMCSCPQGHPRIDSNLPYR